MSFIKLLEENNIEKIESVFGDKLLPFLDSLTFYIDYNDEQSKTEILQYKKELRDSGYLVKPKHVYRLERLQAKELNRKPRMNSLLSASTTQLNGKMLELMKNMISSIKKRGTFYYLKLTGIEGLDINEFAKVFLKNKKYLIDKYDVQGGHIMTFFFDTIENKSEQKEFLIFRNYQIQDKIKV